MQLKILYILGSYNLFGGTPKKTLDLMDHFGEQSVLYVYENTNPELKEQFAATGGKLYEGFFGRNIFLHLNQLLKIIDQENINIVQTQFTMGEVLGFLIKIFRPQVKLVVAFVGPFKPKGLKARVANLLYKKVDYFVYVSKYVKKEKLNQFPILKEKNSSIIFNGSKIRLDTGEEVTDLKGFSLLDIAGLVDWKNIRILIEALNIIINENQIEDVNLYVAGDGPERKDLELLIAKYKLESNIFLLGYQSNIGGLLNSCNLFVHPSYAEGFGIIIPEAMLAEKPIIVANSGALPEIINDNKTGLVVEPHNPQEWAVAILKIKNNQDYAKTLAKNAKIKAVKNFSINNFVSNYTKLYKSLVTE